MLPLICKIPPFRSSHCLHKFQLIFVASLSTSNPEISIYDYLVNRHQFSPQCAEKVFSSSPIKFLDKPQNADSVISFLKENGFAKNQIETLIRKAPFLLSSNLETSVKPKFRVFKELGFHSTELVDVISSSPCHLRSSADRLRHSILVLKKFLGPDADILGLLRICGSQRLLAYDLDSYLAPNIEYLSSCGICSLQIVNHVCRHPRSFIIKLEKLKDSVQRVDEMGVPRESKIFIEAVRVMCCMSRKNWETKLKLFRELGFSEQDILLGFRKSPNVFALSERKIKEVTLLLLSAVDFSYIASNPHLYTYSLEKRLKPRLRVLKALESRNLLKERPALLSICKMTDAKFMHKYVSPYLDEYEICNAARGALLSTKS